MVKEDLGLKFVTSEVAVVIIMVGNDLFNEEVFYEACALLEII